MHGIIKTAGTWAAALALWSGVTSVVRAESAAATKRERTFTFRRLGSDIEPVYSTLLTTSAAILTSNRTLSVIWAFQRIAAVSALLATCALAQEFITFKGMCDASGAVWLGKRLLVINDDDQDHTLLRAYDPDSPDKPKAVFEVPHQGLQFDPAKPEIDLEGITWIGDTLWLIGSHSRNKDAKPRRTRHNLIAMPFKNGQPAAARSLSILLPALQIAVTLADKKLKDIDPAVDPKNGGLSIEGLSATAAGDLLIGLRSPLDSQSRAIVALLKNPNQAVTTNRVETPLQVFQLDLGGTGVRDLYFDPEKKRHYILSGPAGELGPEKKRGPFKIWRWDLESKPKELHDITSMVPPETAPEALLRPANGKGFLVLLDEGKRQVGALNCGDPANKTQSFKGFRVPE